MDEVEKLKQEVAQLKEKLKEKAEKQKQGMINKAGKGSVMSRAPFGYKIEQGKLVPAENRDEIVEIFEEFLNSKVSLRQLSE